MRILSYRNHEVFSSAGNDYYRVEKLKHRGVRFFLIVSDLGGRWGCEVPDHLRNNDWSQWSMAGRHIINHCADR